MIKKIFYNLLLFAVITTLTSCNKVDVDVIVIKFETSVNEVLQNNQFDIPNVNKNSNINNEIQKLNQLLKSNFVIRVSKYIQEGEMNNSNLKKYYSITTVKLNPSQRMELISSLSKLSFINDAYIAPVGEDAGSSPLPE